MNREREIGIFFVGLGRKRPFNTTWLVTSGGGGPAMFAGGFKIILCHGTWIAWRVIAR